MTDYWQLIDIVFCSIGFPIALASKLELSPINALFFGGAIYSLLNLCFGK